MARRERVVLECDMCGRHEDQVPVDTHTVTVDGHGVEAEVCDECWAKKVVALLAGLSRVGRPASRRKQRQPKIEAHPWPGSSWKFTSHALRRIGERHLDPMQVVEAAEDPTQTYPGKLPESTVHRRGQVKAVVNADRRIIITAALRGEDDEED